MDHTQAEFGLSREAFLDHLVASKLLVESDLQAFAAAYAESDAIELAHVLAKSGALTQFQIDAIGEGKPGSLRIGNYDILDRLGAGGMGTVFKARHRRMKRIVALKVLSAAFCKDESFIQRFQREVETIARLGHPNIVMAYDADEAEIGHFLVMEFVDGRDLASTVEKQGPLDVVHALDYTIQAARGLGYAHSLQIVHRDIKPANLMLDRTGVVKVTDLGLARLNSTSESSTGTTGITQAGGILGTVDYMAPEQAIDSTTVDHRADIYSLGCALFFLLTGRPVYVGGTILALLMKHREGPIPALSGVRPDVPAELEGIFEKMVAKSAEARYANMAEVVTALEGVLQKLSGAGSIAAPAATSIIPSTGSSIAVGRPDQQTIVTPPRGAMPSVLVVEPSRMQAGIIRKYLEAQQISVASVVPTGNAALEVIRTSVPEAIVSSLHLDDMTGIDLAKQVREEFKPNAPGFVLISSESEQDTSAISQLNRTVVLHKPFSAAQLFDSVKLVTGKSLDQVKSTDFSIAGLSGVKPAISGNRAGTKVLIVDDSVVARTHERGVLQQLGFSNFVEAADGAQAIAAATREPFDLIITDYNMPLMDGLAFVSYLRQTPALAAVPIVMVTTETEPHILEPVRQLGVAAIFPKEFPAGEVAALLDRLF